MRNMFWTAWRLVSLPFRAINELLMRPVVGLVISLAFAGLMLWGMVREFGLSLSHFDLATGRPVVISVLVAGALVFRNVRKA